MKTIETKAKGITINAELFTGINDFLAVYEDKPTSEAYKEHDTAAHLQDEVYTESRQDFTGVEGYEDAVNKFRNGVNVNAIKTARAAAVTGMKRRVKHSVCGGRVSVPSYLSGSPACMRRSAKMPAKTELNVVVDTSVHCGVSAEQITKAGQTIVQYITDLEARYNVNLHAVVSISFEQKSRGGYKDAYVCGIKIKDAGKPFSAARVSFCLTSAAFLRVFGFLFITRKENVPFSFGLGYPTSNEIEQERDVMNALYKNAVLVSLAEVVRRGEKGLPTA